MKDLKPEIQKLIAERERDFIFSPTSVERLGLDEFAERMAREYYHLKTFVLDSYEQIGEEESTELAENIENKLSIDEILAGPSNYWWTPASPNASALLRQISRVLDRQNQTANRKWRRFGGYAKEVVFGLIYLVIVASVFLIANNRFETAVIAILVLLYNIAVRSLRGLSLLHYVSMTAQLRALGQISRHLRLMVPVRSVAELEGAAERHAISVWIELVFLGLGSLIAFWQLAKSLWL